MRGTGLLALPLACLLVCACGDDDVPEGSSSGKDGGGQDQPSGGKGGASGKGGRGGSAASGSGGAGGKAGSSGRGGSGGNVASGPGTFDDHWKRRSVRMTVIDPTNPTGFKDETIELPDRIANPVDGRELDLYIQIKDDKRYTYALFEGDQVYYRMTSSLIKTDDTYFDSTGGETQIYELEDGVLKDTRISAVGTYAVTSESTYERAAEFPPADWPTDVLDTVELMP